MNEATRQAAALPAGAMHPVEANHPLDALLRPRSIAVAGASSDPGKVGSLPLAFLRKFAYGGALYPINARTPEIAGLPCHPSLSALGETVDLLVVAVAAERIPALLEDALPGQVRHALVLSSNFAESDARGAQLQRELVALARRKGIRIIGPNSVGVVNLWDGVVATISQVFDQRTLAPGPVAFVSQSGAVGTAITALAHEQGIGIGYFVSTGNEADVEFSDLCDRFIDDPRVGIIAGYLESVRDGDRFRCVARRALVAGKPIVLVKVGTTDVGSRAVRSHTGLLAGSDAVYEAVFAECGIVRAEGIEHLLDCLKMFVAYGGGVPASGTRVAVLSHSGGAGVMMGDAAVSNGMAMPPPSRTLTGTLEQRLPAYAALGNPIDMTANVIFDPALMAGSVEAVARSGEYDAVMLCVNLIWRRGEDLAEALAAVRANTDTPVAVAWIAGLPEALRRLAARGVPVFGDPLRCVRAVAARLRWGAARSAMATRTAGGVQAQCAPAEPLQTDAAGIARGSRTGREIAHHASQEALLRDYAIPLAQARLVAGVGEACGAALNLGYPVAAKLVSPSLTHKSDIGGVALNLGDEAALRAACARLLAIPCADREGLLVQKMVTHDDAVEVIVGFNRDPVFGPVLLLGLGGLFVEVMREVVMRPAPLSESDALAMIGAARFAPLLTGARGRPPCDLDALARLVARVAALATNEPYVQAIDLNPVLTWPTGAVAVDFRFEIAPPVVASQSTAYRIG